MPANIILQLEKFVCIVFATAEAVSLKKRVEA
jgi:hypothetical protein